MFNLRICYEVYERHLGYKKDPFVFYMRSFKTEMEALAYIEKQYEKLENSKLKFHIIKTVTK